MVSLSKEYNQIVNLTKFNVNFSKYVDSCDLLKQSPDYILEKYNHWIGFEPMVEHKRESQVGTNAYVLCGYELYTPDDTTGFFNKYCKIWKLDTKGYHKLKNILIYLYFTQNLNVITMSERFERYIGPMTMISDTTNKPGLHHRTNKFVDEILEGNKNNIKVVLRDMKINNIVCVS